MKKLILFLSAFTLYVTCAIAQSDITPESRLNVSSSRNVSGNENYNSSVSEVSNVPQDLLKKYNQAIDSHNEQQKITYAREIDTYLKKPAVNNEHPDIQVIRENPVPFNSDWYNNDVLINNSEIVANGCFRQIDLKFGEDGCMYAAINRKNVTGFNGAISVYRSSNGGADWVYTATIASSNVYFGSFSMLVESKNNSIPDSTRILLYITMSPNLNLNDAFLECTSFRRDGTSPIYSSVASPAAGNKFVYPSACSDGMFWSSVTFMHAVVREETNAGVNVRLHHFRTIDWGVNHTDGLLNTGFDDRYPSAAFSNEIGNDSIYIAVEREVFANEHEIRLIATPEIPAGSMTLRYITDAPAGTLYERPAITIQQRHESLPQRILVTCTKNDRAVYHFSTDGGAAWNIDFGLGLISQTVDFTSCSSDSLYAGGKDFMAAYINLTGDSVTVRHGELGFLGVPQYKINHNPASGVIAPVCAIYKEGINKYSAFAYAGYGPYGIYYNMEHLLSGIENINGNIPKGYSLSQNYPNPFNPVTNIEFAVSNRTFVKLVIYDILGKAVELLVNGEYAAGTYKADWNAANYPSGVYFYKLETGSFTDVKKMILVK